MTSKFLRLKDVLALHDEQIRVFGGSPGVRDLGLLESAVEQPGLFVFGELVHPDIASQAAAYLYHIAKNHAFVDGNKRTALAAALVFLQINGKANAITNAVAFELTLGVANGSISKEQLTHLLRFAPVGVDSVPHWLHIAITAAEQGIPVEEIPEINMLFNGLREAFLRSGIQWIGKTDSAPAAYLLLDRDGMKSVGCNIVFMDIHDHINTAHLIGMSEAEVRAVHALPLHERARRCGPYLQSTFLKAGVQRLALRSRHSHIGWRPTEVGVPDFGIVNVGHMPFVPEALEAFRREAAGS